MVRPKKEQLEKLKKQDKELAKLPSLEQEKKRFKKGESLLKKMTRTQTVEFDLHQLAHSRKTKLKRKKKTTKKKAKKKVKKR
jgi:hypothetical protein